MCLGTRNAAPASRLQASPSNLRSQGQDTLTTAVLGQGPPEGDVDTPDRKASQDTRSAPGCTKGKKSYRQTRDQKINEPFSSLKSSLRILYFKKIILPAE